MSKQPKVVAPPKEAAKIEDRPVVMAPSASIKAGLQFFRDKCAAEDQAIREGFHPLSVLEAQEVLLALKAVLDAGTERGQVERLAGRNLLGRYNLK